MGTYLNILNSDFSQNGIYSPITTYIGLDEQQLTSYFETTREIPGAGPYVYGYPYKFEHQSYINALNFYAQSFTDVNGGEIYIFNDFTSGIYQKYILGTDVTYTSNKIIDYGNGFSKYRVTLNSNIAIQPNQYIGYSFYNINIIISYLEEKYTMKYSQRDQFNGTLTSDYLVTHGFNFEING